LIRQTATTNVIRAQNLRQKKLKGSGIRRIPARKELFVQGGQAAADASHATSRGEDIMAQGIIKKIVRASLSIPGSPSVREHASGVEGYGIIRTLDGRDVFFIHTAVQGDRFQDLHEGLRVDFTLEEGPMGHATSVAVGTEQTTVSAS
jgi:cold shock CspA family protein